MFSFYFDENFYNPFRAIFKNYYGAFAFPHAPSMYASSKLALLLLLLLLLILLLICILIVPVAILSLLSLLLASS